MNRIRVNVDAQTIFNNIRGMTFDSPHHRISELHRLALIHAKRIAGLDCGFKDVKITFDPSRLCYEVTLDLYEEDDNADSPA